MSSSQVGISIHKDQIYFDECPPSSYFDSTEKIWTCSRKKEVLHTLKSGNTACLLETKKHDCLVRVSELGLKIMSLREWELDTSGQETPGVQPDRLRPSFSTLSSHFAVKMEMSLWYKMCTCVRCWSAGTWRVMHSCYEKVTRRSILMTSLSLGWIQKAICVMMNLQCGQMVFCTHTKIQEEFIFRLSLSCLPFPEITVK